MATLKICVLNRTHWITEVKGVQLLRSFSVPDDAENRQIDGLAFEPGFEAPKVYSIADFDGQGTGRIGNVLSVDKDGFSETWLVPAGACFLMSESGKTIDRI